MSMKPVCLSLVFSLKPHLIIRELSRDVNLETNG